MGCSPWGRKESDTTERLHFHFSLSCIGEGNGNPLQCSCLENPRDGGAWWAAVYGVAQSWTRLRRLSSSSSSSSYSKLTCQSTLGLKEFIKILTDFLLPACMPATSFPCSSPKVTEFCVPSVLGRCVSLFGILFTWLLCNPSSLMGSSYNFKRYPAISHYYAESHFLSFLHSKPFPSILTEYILCVRLCFRCWGQKDRHNTSDLKNLYSVERSVTYYGIRCNKFYEEQLSR